MSKRAKHSAGDLSGMPRRAKPERPARSSEAIWSPDADFYRSVSLLFPKRSLPPEANVLSRTLAKGGVITHIINLIIVFDFKIMFSRIIHTCWNGRHIRIKDTVVHTDVQ